MDSTYGVSSSPPKKSEISLLPALASDEIDTLSLSETIISCVLAVTLFASTHGQLDSLPCKKYPSATPSNDSSYFLSSFDSKYNLTSYFTIINITFST